MRLREGIVPDTEKTFGELRFAALHAERPDRDAEGNVIGIKSRTYDLKSKAQGMTVQVILPAELPEKDFPYNAPAKLVNASVDSVANATYNGRAEGNWYVKADDIVLIDAKEGDVPKAGAAPQPGDDAAKAGAAPQAKKG